MSKLSRDPSDPCRIALDEKGYSDAEPPATFYSCDGCIIDGDCQVQAHVTALYGDLMTKLDAALAVLKYNMERDSMSWWARMWDRLKGVKKCQEKNKKSNLRPLV